MSVFIRGKPIACTGPDRVPGAGLKPGKSAGPGQDSVLHGGAEVAVRKSALDGLQSEYGRDRRGIRGRLKGLSTRPEGCG